MKEPPLLRPAYIKWRDGAWAPFLARLVAHPVGRAELADLHATLGRFLGVEAARPPRLETRARVKHCSCAYCRAHRDAPRHGPYSVREFWDPSSGKAGAWRTVPKGRKGWVRPKPAGVDASTLPRAATAAENERIRSALVND